MEEISYNNVKLQSWDLGGQESTRSIWEVYYVNTDAVIYAIDTHDESYADSKTQFYKLLENEILKNAIILIYANKQDLPGAKSISDIIQIYELDTIKDHIWHIQPCSAQTGEGLVTGMKWLSDQLVYKSNNNFPVNPYVDYSENKNVDKNKKNIQNTTNTESKIEDKENSATSTNNVNDNGEEKANNEINEKNENN